MFQTLKLFLNGYSKPWRTVWYSFHFQNSTSNFHWSLLLKKTVFIHEGNFWFPTQSQILFKPLCYKLVLEALKYKNLWERLMKTKTFGKSSYSNNYHLPTVVLQTISHILKNNTNIYKANFNYKFGWMFVKKTFNEMLINHIVKSFRDDWED